MVFQNNQFASCISQVVPSPISGIDYTSQHRFNSGVCAFTLRIERVSPRPPQTSISHQTFRHKSAQADVLASVALRLRWFTPCSTKLVSVTYWASAYAMRKNTDSPKSSASSTSWMRNGSVRKTVTGCPVPAFATKHPTCQAQVRVLTFVRRAVDDQTAIACPSSFVGHCVPWRSPFESW